jgi:hypothetical protein
MHAAIHMPVEFLREHGHYASDAKKPLPFYGIGSVTENAPVLPAIKHTS